MTASPKRKENRAFFIIIGSHQDPVCLDVPPASLWRLKLPNSLKSGIWSADEFGSCPAGPGKSSRRVIPKILQIIIDFDLDSCYIVIRNRVLHLSLILGNI